jgi:ribosomal protein L37E
MAKIHNRRAQRTCIYCGRTPVTKEHIMSKWLREVWPPSAGDTSNLTYHYQIENFDKKAKESHSKERRGGPFQFRTAKIVCASCNNGWMSRIDAAAKPLLQRMLNSEQMLLDRNHQTVLAAWLAKLTISNEFTTDLQTVSEEHRQYFKNKVECPNGWIVMAGSYAGTYYNKTIRRCSSALQAGTRVSNGVEEGVIGVNVDTPMNTQSTTFAISNIGFHTASSCNSGFNFEPKHQLLDGMLIIWPILSDFVLWPPRPWIGDDIMHKYSTAIYEIAHRAGGLVVPPPPFRRY